MLTGEIKSRMMRAMKEKDEVARNVLGVALGEIQTAEARANKALGDEEAVAILRKLVKSNEETLAAMAGAGERETALRKEIAILSELLPKRMSVAEIAEALASQKDAIRGAKTDGQATGVAMKHLKATGASFDGADVQAAVKQLRS